MEYLNDELTILNLEKALNYTDIRAEYNGSYFKCHKCPVTKLGANLMLDCIEISYDGQSGLVYGGFQDVFTSTIVSGPITQLCSSFAVVMSFPDNGRSMSEIQKYADVVQHINGRCLFKMGLKNFQKCVNYSNLLNIFIPDAPQPVLFSKLYYEDIYRIRFDYEASFQDIHKILYSKNWSSSRISKCLYDLHLLSMYDCSVVLKHDVSK